MVNLNIIRTISTELENIDIIDGQLIFVIDTYDIYLDVKTQRVKYDTHAPYSLPIASKDTLGGVKVDEKTLMMNEDNVLYSVNGVYKPYTYLRVDKLTSPQIRNLQEGIYFPKIIVRSASNVGFLKRGLTTETINNITFTPNYKEGGGDEYVAATSHNEAVSEETVYQLTDGIVLFSDTTYTISCNYAYAGTGRIEVMTLEGKKIAESETNMGKLTFTPPDTDKYYIQLRFFAGRSLSGQFHIGIYKGSFNYNNNGAIGSTVDLIVNGDTYSNNITEPYQEITNKILQKEGQNTFSMNDNALAEVVIECALINPALKSISKNIEILPATTSNIGGVKPDGTTITVDDDGTIHGASQGLNFNALSTAMTTGIQSGITVTADIENSRFNFEVTGMPTIAIDSDGYWRINGELGENPTKAQGEKGNDGITPHIDETTKHWYIGESDTGVAAEGKVEINTDCVVLYATLLADGWSDTAPYTQTVAVTSMSADNVAIVDISLSDDNSLWEAEETAYSNLTKVETADGSITAICLKSKPASDFTIKMKIAGDISGINVVTQSEFDELKSLVVSANNVLASVTGGIE